MHRFAGFAIVYLSGKKEFNLDLSKAKYFAGHSLGEYSALSAAGYLSFSETIKLLRLRGDAMQNAVPEGEGGMLAVLGSTVETIEKIYVDGKFENYRVTFSNGKISNVPLDETNRHYQEIQKWIAEGNTVIDNPPE